MAEVFEVDSVVKDFPLARGWRARLRDPLARRRVRALDGLSLRLNAGERVALVGPNGAGKTTLVRVACGVVRPDSGRVWICGRPATGGAGWRSLVGLGRPDDPALHPRLSVLECLRFHAALYAVAGGAPRLLETLELTGAAAFASRRVQTLSGGEKARVSLAKALLHGPRLLVLDELSRVLDPGAAQRTRELLARVAAQGTAVLLVTHDLAEAAACDRTLVLARGRLAAQGPWAGVEAAAREVFGL